MKQSFAFMALAATLLLSQAAFADNPNLVLNGNFSTWPTNMFLDWTTSAPNPDMDGVCNWPVGGVCNPAFPAGGWISQTIPTSAGTNYSFSFFLDGPGGYSEPFMVTWNSNLVNLGAAISSTSPAGTLYTVTEVGTGPFTTIEFAAGGPYTNVYFLTDVSVTSLSSPTPEPATLGLFLSGLAGLSGFARRALGKR